MPGWRRSAFDFPTIGDKTPALAAILLSNQGGKGMEYRYGSHTVYQIEYHFVWVTKYRYRVLTGVVA